MDASALDKLDFHRIREALAVHCASRLGAQLALRIEPSSDGRMIREWLDQVRELASVASERSLPPLGGIYDVREPVRAAGQATPLEPEALAQIGETLDATANVRAWFTLVGDQLPTLGKLAQRLGDHGAVVTAINDAIDARGEVRDMASSKLANVRRAIRRGHDEVKACIHRLLKQASLTKLLQYANPTFHGDRVVLPLKSEHRGRIPGIVHRVSDSGATLFVEPSESVALNNSITQLREMEGKEITRILRELTQMVFAEMDAILESLRALAILDLVAAKVKYARQRNCTCPEVNDDGVIDLHDARHPLLVELFAVPGDAQAPAREVVPIDVRLGDDFDVLMVTGPNTGGKTVALKTVGLLLMLAQAGMPIPVAEGSRVPVLKNVFVDIGDEQSLQQSLSTFSSHLSNQLSILARCGPGSLVLIDELGAGTDPDEGAAIGCAVVEEILRRGSMAFITTHLSELKALAFRQDRVDNASVEFDVQSLSPTYRLRIGEPGNSNALIIASRLGMSKRLVERARSHLDTRNAALNKAIAGTLKSRREAEQARKSARQIELEADRRREEYERERQALQVAREGHESWVRWVNQLHSGDRVFVESINRNAKVVRMQLHQQKAVVTSGALEIEVPLGEIQTPREEASQ